MGAEEELTVNQFAKAVGRPVWVIQGWCAAGLIRARITGSLRYRINKKDAACYANGVWKLPDGEPPNQKKQGRLAILGEASLLLVKNLPEKTRKEVIKVIDQTSKGLRQKK